MIKDLINGLKVCKIEFSGDKNISLRCATFYNKIGFIYSMCFPKIVKFENKLRDIKKQKLLAKYDK